ncbi:hypothetical protein BIT28_24305 [Photobacterium proteolyticum]|uniref:Uncharacterized protein n=1 Tax=Photobacterium proteolyticum TaxID=1903952 RepID=A0A1Q9GCM6_9GAMM|nr:hypothetical protein [Photobacterium proteolyticum]OLQ72155.1 hypothetical protein BIT28_24305 [Photobacterium proteolyticum]
MKSAIILVITVLLVFTIKSVFGLDYGILSSGFNFITAVSNLAIFVTTYSLVSWVVEKVIPLGNLNND